VNGFHDLVVKIRKVVARRCRCGIQRVLLASRATQIKRTVVYTRRSEISQYYTCRAAAGVM
jgi:hypothetical protein